jgi:hypothetical protein
MEFLVSTEIINSMKRDVLKRIFEMSRIMKKLPDHKIRSLYNEIVKEYISKSIPTIDFDDFKDMSEEKKVLANNFINFFDHKLKFARVVNCIPKDPALDEEFEREFPTDQSVISLSIEELIQPQTLYSFDEFKGSNGKTESETKETLSKSFTENLEKESKETEKKDPRLEDIENFVAGKYYVKDGRLIKGDPESRQISQYSNWTAGNVDPEDLERHKKLLDRQHFGGPFWEGKRIPKSIEEELPDYVPEDVEDGDVPIYLQGVKQGEQTFKKVRG